MVDNGSGPETALALERELRIGGLQLRIVRHETTRGPSGGRNSGWRHARADLVAFTDDDCVADSRWLEHARGVAQRHPGAVIQGPTRPDPSELDRRDLLSYTVEIDTLGPQYETCNIFYPRELLESLDGFDESYGLEPAGEDTDLAWRAIAAGRKTVFADEALVYHAVERVGLAGQLRRAARWSDVVRVYADHPETRSMLHRRVFWTPWHYLLLRSLASLLAPRWLRTMLLARYLLQLVGRARRMGATRSQLPWSVPYLVVHDAVECWSIARGAVRYRTLVI